MFKRNRTPELPAYGDAHFATLAEMERAGLLGPRGIPLGYYREPGKRKGWGQKILYAGDAGLILIAPTRSGKGRDVLVEALLQYEQSVIVTDPKGELAAVTKAKRERMGQRVITLNPFGLWPEILGPSARYNPMDLLDPTSTEFDIDCRKLAEGLIAKSHDKDTHWVSGARGLPTGVIGGLVAHGSSDTKNLGYMREVICNDDLLLRYARASMQSEHAFIRQEMKTYSVAEPFNAGEIASFRQTAHEQTFFLGMKQMIANLSQSDFRFSELKERPTTVYIILPDNRLDVCGRWFRLIVASALDDLWRGGKGKCGVLAILDEMSSIGHLDVLENAAAAAAGRGLQIWPILQNLSQLKKDYGDSWETFLSAAEIQMFMAPRDQTTAEYISKQSGQRTVTTAGQSIRNNGPLGQANESDSSGQAGQPLIRPHEISGFGPNEALIIGPQNIVINALRQPYFHTPELEFMYAANPMHEATVTPPPPRTPETITTFADMLAASEEQAERTRRSRRPLALRLLCWSNSRNPYLNALLKLEYVLTLPLRLLLALLLLPFAIHNRPLGATLGFFALFGFWEVFNGFAKEPLLQINHVEQEICVWQRYAHDNRASEGSSMGHVMACKATALRATLAFVWRNFGSPLMHKGPTQAAITFDLAFDQERKKSWVAASAFADYIVDGSIKRTFGDFKAAGYKPQTPRLNWSAVPDGEKLGELRAVKSSGLARGDYRIYFYELRNSADEAHIKDANADRARDQTPYGATEDHAVEITLGEATPRTAPFEFRYVLSNDDDKPVTGWIHDWTYSNRGQDSGDTQSAYLVRTYDGKTGMAIYISQATERVE